MQSKKRLVSIAGSSLERCIVLRGARDPQTLGTTMGSITYSRQIDMLQTYS